MVAVISSADLGVTTSNGSMRGRPGVNGSGQNPEQIFINTTTGNLVIQQRDEWLKAAGLDLAMVRTYNSQGVLDGDNNDNWRLGIYRNLHSLTGSPNSAGSTITKTFGDGAEVLYTFDGTAYVSTDGDDAHDTLTYNSGTAQWTFTDGSSRSTEIYDINGRLLSSRDVDGNEVTYTYSGNLLVRIDDESGQSTHLDYAGNNLTQIRVVSAGQTQIRTRYFYDNQDRLTQVVLDLDLVGSPSTTPLQDVNADNFYDTVNGQTYVTRYTYDGASTRIASITQGDGTRVSFEHTDIDGTYRVTKYTDGFGRDTVITYSSASSSGLTSQTANASPGAISTTESQPVVVPSYYVVQAGDTWASVAQAIYGVSGAEAVTALQSATGNPALTAGYHLTVPLTLNYSVTSGSVNISAPATTSVLLTSEIQNLTHNFSGVLTTPTQGWLGAASTLQESLGTAINNPIVGFDGAGNAFALWRESANILVSRYDRTTGLWGTPTQLDGTNTASITTPQLYVDASGNAIASWIQNDGAADPGSVWVAQYVGGSWSPAFKVDTGTVAAQMPYAKINGAGQAVVVWRQPAEGTTTPFNLLARRYTGGAWQAVDTVNTSTQNITQQPYAAIDLNGNVQIVWQQSDGTAASAFSRRFDNGTGLWSAVSSTTFESSATAINDVQVAFDGAGNGFALWRENANVLVRRYNVATGVWAAASSLDGTNSAAITTPQLYVDASGTAIATWIQADGGVNSVWVSRYVSGAWTAAVAVDTGASSGQRAALMPYGVINAAGQAAVVWRQQPNGADAWYDVYSNRFDGGAWQGVTLLDNNNNSVTQQPYVSIDGSGNIQTLWQQSDGAASVFSNRYQKDVTPYYTVPAGASWQSIANALYGVNSPAAGTALQTAMGNPPLTTNLRLTNFPPSIQVPTSVTVPSYYVVQAGQSWSDIALAIYGTNYGPAVTALQSATGNPALTAGYHLTVPLTLNYSVTSGSVNISAPATTSVLLTSEIQNLTHNFSGVLTTPTQGWLGAASTLQESLGTAINNPIVGFDGAGNAFALWRESANILVSRYDRTTGLWGTPTQLDGTNTASITTPQLYVDASGNAIASWIQNDGAADPGSVWVAQYVGGSWSPAFKVDTGTVAAQMPYAKINGAGQAVVVWRQPAEGTTTPFNLLARRYTGGAWQAVDTVNTSTQNITQQPYAAIDLNGNVQIVWQQSDGTAASAFSRRFDNGTGLWSAVSSTTFESSATAINDVQVAFDGAGNGFALWRENANVLVRRYNVATGVWAAASSLDGTNSAAITTPQLYVDASGTAIATWIQADGGVNSVWVSRYVSGAWTAAVAVDTGASSGQRAALMPYGVINAAGQAAVVWRQQPNGADAWYDVYSNRFDGGAWQGVTLLDNNNNSVTQQPYVSIDGSGNIQTLWQQSDGAASVFSNRYQKDVTPYYTVPAGASWQSIANALYGVNSPAAGTALQTAMGNPPLTTNLRLTNFPPSIQVPTSVTVPSYYVVQAGQSWSDIALAIYGTNYGPAVTALQSATGNPALTAGYHLTVPLTLNYTATAGGAPVNYSVPANQVILLTTEIQLVPVPAYYTVQGADTWTSIAQAVYGTNASAAVTEFQDQVQALYGGSLPNLTPNLHLTVPLTFAYGGALTIYQATEVEDALGNITTYLHDGEGRLTSVRAPEGLRADYHYDSEGNIDFMIEDPLGVNRRTDYFYENGNLRISRDALGNTVERTYNAANQVLSVAQYLTPDPDAINAGVAPANALTSRFIYDNEQHLRFGISAEGRVTEYRYSPTGTGTHPDGALMATLTYRDALYTGGAFTEAALTAWVSGGGRDLTQTTYNSFEYDFRGNVSASRAYATANSSGIGTGVASVTRFVYDQRGNLLSKVEPRGELTGVANDYLTSYAYDGQSRLLSTTEWLETGRTRTSVTSYDDANNRTVTTLANIVDGVDRSLTATSTYNASGELLSLASSGATSGLVGSATYVYDEAGRLRFTTDATGVRQHVLYDDAGRKIADVDGNGTLTEYVYNGASQIIKTIRYATAINPLLIADASGVLTGATLDGSLRALANANPAENQVMRTVYDAIGRVAYSIDQVGAVMQYFYDGASRLTRTVAYANAVSIDSSAGELRPIDSQLAEDSASTVRTFTLVGGSTAGTLSLDGAHDRRIRYFYDADGNRTAILDAEGYLSEYLRDPAGFLYKQVGYANQTNAAYWQAGTLQQLRPPLDNETASDPEQDIVSYFFYDGQGRQVGSLDAEGYLSETQYDVAGLITATIQYGRHNAVGVDLGGLTYQAGDTLQSLKLRLPAGAVNHTTSFLYDGAGRLKQEVDHEGTVTVSVYDDANNLVRATIAEGSGDERIARVRYDELGRIVRELSADGSAALTALGASPTQIQIDDVWNKYGVTYAYDLAGRRISMNRNVYDPTSGTQQTQTSYFYYNEDNQLRFSVNVVNILGVTQGEVTESRYNALGQITEQFAYTNRIAAAGLNGGLLNAALTAQLTPIADTGRDQVTSRSYTLRGEIRTILGSSQGVNAVNSYDAFGQVFSRTEQVDATRTLGHSYQYDRRGLLTDTAWDPSGLNTTEHRAYDAFGRLTSVTDARGNTSYMRYDRLGRTIETLDAIGGALVTAYDAFSRTLTTRDALLNSTTYRYDDAARSVVVTTPEGLTMTTVRNRHGQTATMTDARNIQTVYAYSKSGVLKTVTRAGEVQSDNVLDSADRVVINADANGNITRVSYDAANRVFSRTVETGEASLTTTYKYDGQGRSIEMTDLSGTVTRMDYDSDGRLVERVVDPSGLNIRTSYAYNRRGDVITVTEGAGSANPRVTQYAYDVLGRRTQEVVAPGSLNLTTNYEYDKNGNIVRKQDANGHFTWYAYDVDDRLRFVVDAPNNTVGSPLFGMSGVTETRYDAEDQATSVRRYATPITLTNPSVVELSTNDVLALLSADNSRDRLEVYLYDRDGRQTYSIDAAGGVTRIEYDGNDNVVRQTMYADRVNTHTYYANATSVTNQITLDPAADRVARTVYDSLDRAAYAVDALGGVTRYEYDRNGNMIAMTAFATQDASVDTSGLTSMNSWASSHQSINDRTTQYWYDGANRLRFTKNAEGYVSELRYDEALREQSSIDYAGRPTIASNATLSQVAAAAAAAANTTLDQSTRTTYDSAGRVSRVYGAEYNAAVGNFEEYGYDAIGNRTSFTNQNGDEWTYLYDSNRRLTDEYTPLVDVTTVEGDESGYGLSSSGGSVSIRTHMEYDAFGNVLSRAEAFGTPQVRTTSYEYDSLGRQIRTVLPDVSVYSGGDANFSGILTETTHSRALGNSLYSEVTYDTLGNAIRSRDIAGNLSFKAYDVLGRVLFDVDAEKYVTGRTYDRFGNQESITRYAAPLTGTVPSSLRALHASGSTIVAVTSSGSVNLAVTLQSTVDRTLTSQYDLLNRVTRVSEAAVLGYEPGSTPGIVGRTFTAGPTTLTEYNAFGEVSRTRRLVDPEFNSYAETRYYYDHRGLKVAEVDPLRYLTVFEYDDSTGDITRQIEYAQALTTFDPTVSPPTVTPNDRVTSFSYDRLNRKATETLVGVRRNAADGAALAPIDVTTTYGYDYLGNQVTVTVNNAVTHTYYDVLGRVIAVAEPERQRGDGTSVTPLTVMKRDVFGNIVEQTQYARGASSTPDWTIGTLPNLVGADAAVDRTSRMLLDNYGRVVRAEDPLGIDRFGSYNMRGELAKEWQVVTNAGDPGTSADDTIDTLVTIYKYDALGRQTEIIEPQAIDPNNSANNVVVTRAAQYNAFGEVTTKSVSGALSGNGGESFDYDQAGRVWRSNAGDGVYKVYLYNLAGQSTAEIKAQYNATIASEVDLSTVSLGANLANLPGTTRMETLYDMLGRVLEQRETTFNASDLRQPFNADPEIIVNTDTGEPFLSWTPLLDQTLHATVTITSISNPAISYTYQGGLVIVEGEATGDEGGYNGFAFTGVNISALASDSYSFVINYSRTDDTVARFTATGTFDYTAGSVTTVTPDSGVALESIQSVSGNVAGSTVQISWSASAAGAGIAAQLQVFIGGAWQTFVATLGAGNVYTATLPLQSAGAYQYRIVHTDSATGRTQALGRGALTFTAAGSVTTLSVFPTPQDPGATVGTVSIVGGSTLRWAASLEGNEAGYDLTATLQLVQGGTTLTPTVTYTDSGDTRTFSANLASLAAGSWTYTINHVRSGTIVGAATGTVTSSGQGSARIVSGAAVGAGSPPPVATSVAGLSVQHFGSSVEMSWDASGDARIGAYVQLSTDNVNWGPSYSAILQGNESNYRFAASLPTTAGTFYYRIIETTLNQTLVAATGTLTVTATGSSTTLAVAPSASDPASTVGTVSVTGGSTLRWTGSLDGNEAGYDLSATLQLVQGGTTLTPTVTYTDSGDTRTFSANLSSLAAGSWTYTISHLRNGTVVGAATGTVTSSGPSTQRTVSGATVTAGSAPVAPTPISVVNASISGGVTTLSWSGPNTAAVTAQLELKIQGAPTWNAPVAVNRSGGTYSVNVNYPANVYDYRITQYRDGQVEVVATGSLTITAASSTTSLSIAPSASDPGSTVGTVSVTGGSTLRWTGSIVGNEAGYDLSATLQLVQGGTTLTPTVTYTDSGDTRTFSANLSSLAAGSWTYTISHLRNGTVVGAATGTVTSSGPSTQRTVSGATVTAGSAPAAPNPISSVSASLIGSTIYMSWIAPNSPDATATILINGVTYTAQLQGTEDGYVFAVSGITVPAGTHTYTITERINGQVLQTAVGSVTYSAGSSTTTTAVGSLTPDSWVAVGVVSASASAVPQASGSVASSAAAGYTQVPDGEGGYYDVPSWNGTNTVNLSWVNVSSQAINVVVAYRSANSPTGGGVDTAVVRSYSAGVAPNGASISWTDTSPGDGTWGVGGIAYINYVAVYDASWNLIRYSGYTASNTQLSWAAPSDPSYVATVVYKEAGSSNWQFVYATRNAGSFIADLSSLNNGTYDYEISQYIMSGETPVNMATKSGQFSVSGSSASVLSQTGTPACLTTVSAPGNRYLSWSGVPSGGSIGVTIRNSGGAVVLTPAATPIGGGNYQADLFNLPTGSYTYTIEYNNGGVYLRGTGSIYITTNTVVVNPSVSATNPSNTLYPIANVIPTASSSASSQLNWSYPTGGVATTVTLTYSINGGAQQQQTFSGPGSFDFTSVTSGGANIAYSISYRRNSDSVVYAFGNGTFSFTATTTPVNASVSTSGQTPIYPSVPGVTGLTDRGNGVMSWNEAASGGSVQVRYSVIGSGSWSGWNAASAYGGGYAYDFNALANNTYEFEIRYINGANIYRFQHGIVGVTHTTINPTVSASAPSNTQYPIANVIPTASSSTSSQLNWSYPTGGVATTVTLTYSINGGAQQQQTFSGPGSFDFTSVTSGGASIAYTISYRRNSDNFQYARGSGTFSFTATTTPVNASVSTSGQTPIYPSVPGVTGLTDRGNGVMSWNEAASGGSVQVRYSVIGSGSWSGWNAASAYGGGYAYDFNALANNTYEFEIRYINGANIYRFQHGTVGVIHNTINPTANVSAPSSTLYPIASVIPTASSSTSSQLNWSYPTGGVATTVTLTYSIDGGAQQQQTFSGPGSFDFTSVTSGTANIDYVITYRRNSDNTIYAQGTGTFSFTATTNVINSTVTTGGQTGVYPSVPGVTGLTDRGNGVMSWNEAASGGSVQVRYSVIGSGSWSGWNAASAYGGGYAYDFNALANNTYEFEVRYINGGTIYRFQHGAVGVTHTTINPTVTPTQPSNLQSVSGFQDLGLGIFGWNEAGNAGDIVQFKYRAAGAASWVSPALTVAYVNGFYRVDMMSTIGLLGNVDFEVTYTAAGDNAPYRVGGGTVNVAVNDTFAGFNFVDTTTIITLAPQSATPTRSQTLDRWGNAVTLTDATGNTTTFQYNRYNNATVVTQPLVEVVSVHRTTAVVDIDQAAPVTYNYFDEYGRLVGTRDANGNNNQAVYNSVGQRLTQINADDAAHVNGAKKHFVYDAFGQSIQVTDEFGYRMRSSYDRNGRLVATAQEVALNVFDAAVESMPDTSTTTKDYVRTNFDYDEANRRIAEGVTERIVYPILDESGVEVGTGFYDVIRRTEYWYDLQDNVVKTEKPSGKQDHYRYDANGRVIEHIDGNNNDETWEYDNFGRMIEHTDMRGDEYDYVYDRAGLLVRQTSEGQVPVTPGNESGYGVRQDKSYVYDGANHLVHIDDDGIGRDTYYSYDAAGRKMRQTTVQNGVVHENTRTEYDSLNRIVHLSGLGFSVTYNYDAANNRTHISGYYAAGSASALLHQDLWYQYDQMNRVTISQGVNTTGDGGVVTIDMDATPGSNQGTDSVTQGTILTYDARGSRASATTYGDFLRRSATSGVASTYFKGETKESYSYDGAGRLKTVDLKTEEWIDNGDETGYWQVAADTNVDTREYDVFGQISKQTTRSPGSGSQINTFEQENFYDLDGQVVRQVNSRLVNGQWKLQHNTYYTNYDGAGMLRNYRVSVYNDGAFQYNSDHTLTYGLGESYQEIRHDVSSSAQLQYGTTVRDYNVNNELIRFVDYQNQNRNRYFVNNVNGQPITVVKGSFGEFDSAQAQQALQSAAQGTDFFRSANAGYFFYGPEGQQVGSFSQLESGLKASFDVNYTPISANYPADTPTSYVAQRGDTLRIIAMKIFGDTKLWYILAEANGLSDPDAVLPEGRTINVPNKVVSLSNDANTFKPFNIGDALGDTTPTQPAIPPPKKGGKGCGIIAMILIIVVMVVVTIFTAGAAAAALGAVASGGGGIFATGVAALSGGLAAGAGGLAAGFSLAGVALVAGAVGGAVGSIVSQGLSIAAGLQEKFSWNQVAMGAISGGIGAGLGQAASGAGTYGKFVSALTNGNKYGVAAVNAAAGSIISQGIGVATGLQEEFSWRSVAAATIAAPIAMAIGEGARSLTSGLGEGVSKFADRFASGFSGGVVQTWVMGGKVDVVNIAADAFGHAVGNAIVDQLVLQGQMRESVQKIAAAKDAKKGSFFDSVQSIARDSSLSYSERAKLIREAVKSTSSSGLLNELTPNAEIALVEPSGAESGATNALYTDEDVGVFNVTTTGRAEMMSEEQQIIADARSELIARFEEFGRSFKSSEDAKKALWDQESLLNQSLIVAGAGLNAVWDGIVGIAELIWNGASAVVRAQVAVGEFVIKSTLDIVTGHPERIQESLQNVFEKVREGYGQLSETLQRTIDGIETFAAVMADPEVGKAAWNMFTGMVQDVSTPTLLTGAAALAGELLLQFGTAGLGTAARAARTAVAARRLLPTAGGKGGAAGAIARTAARSLDDLMRIIGTVGAEYRSAKELLGIIRKIPTNVSDDILRQAHAFATRAGVPVSERSGLFYGYSRLRASGWEIGPSAQYGANHGLDAIFTRTVNGRTQYAILEAKSAGGLGRLSTDTRGLRQGTEAYNRDRLRQAISHASHNERGALQGVLQAYDRGMVTSVVTSGTGNKLWEIPRNWKGGNVPGREWVAPPRTNGA